MVTALKLAWKCDSTGRANLIYNRYGHLVCELPEHPREIAFSLVANNYYILYLSSGDSGLRQIGCRYVVLPDIWPMQSCMVSRCSKLSPESESVFIDSHSARALSVLRLAALCSHDTLSARPQI